MAVGSVLFETGDPATANNNHAVSAVLNTAELLEQILTYIKPYDLLTRVPLTCHTFKHAVETSSTLQKSVSFAIEVTDKNIDGDFTWSWSLAPGRMAWVEEDSRCNRAVFTFDFANIAAFEHQRAIEGFRQLGVCKNQWMSTMIWFYEVTSVSNQMRRTDRGWWFVSAGETLTFGKIFDFAARDIKNGCEVEKIKLLLRQTWRK